MTVHLLIEGKVQGVFYRATAKDKAEKLHIAGWVKNTSEGAVEITCQGEEKSLQEFIAWCRKGPSQARVEKVHVLELPEQNFQGFHIIRRTA